MMLHLHVKVINILAFAKFICGLHHSLAPQQYISLCIHMRILAFPASSELFISPGFFLSHITPTLVTSIPVSIFLGVTQFLLPAFEPFQNPKYNI